jgi:hypothetical protein
MIFQSFDHNTHDTSLSDSIMTIPFMIPWFIPSFRSSYLSRSRGRPGARHGCASASGWWVQKCLSSSIYLDNHGHHDNDRLYIRIVIIIMTTYDYLLIIIFYNHNNNDSHHHNDNHSNNNNNNNKDNRLYIVVFSLDSLECWLNPKIFGRQPS